MSLDPSFPQPAPTDNDSIPSRTLRRPISSGEVLRVKRHSELAKLPTRGSAQSAGYDLYSAENQIVPAHGKALIDTHISCIVPNGTYGRVAPRSGLASKFSLHVGAGVIDADYRGTIRVLLFNLGDMNFEIKAGDRIAQLVLERVANPAVSEVPELDNSPDAAAPPIQSSDVDISRFTDAAATSKATPLGFASSK